MAWAQASRAPYELSVIGDMPILPAATPSKQAVKQTVACKARAFRSKPFPSRVVCPACRHDIMMLYCLFHLPFVSVKPTIGPVGLTRGCFAPRQGAGQRMQQVHRILRI